MDTMTKQEPITSADASFSMRHGFLYMAYPKGSEPCRVQLHRNFPFTYLYRYISVLDMESKELASIMDLEDFEESDKALLMQELDRKYYVPVILKIHSVKERFGFSYWNVETEDGTQTFTLQDTYKSMVRASERTIFLLDVDGNRFLIPDVDALDKKSKRKIEIYL